MPAAQGDADRHTHDVLDMAVDIVVSLCGLSAAHIPALSRADWRDSRYPSLVTVAPLTMSISALCASRCLGSVWGAHGVDLLVLAIAVRLLEDRDLGDLAAGR